MASLGAESDAEALIGSEHRATGSSCACTRKAAVGAAVLAVAALAAATAPLVYGGSLRPRGSAPPHGPKSNVRRLPRWSPSGAAEGGHGRMLQNTRERTCTAVAGRDILGDTMGSAITGQSSGSCRQHCLTNSRCGCYSFDPSRNGTCWLKKNPCSELDTSQESVDMTSGSCQQARPRVCTSVRGKDVMSDVLVSKDGHQMAFKNEDAIKCRARCQETGGCDCYAFDPSRNSTCWLKTGACDSMYEWNETNDMSSGTCREQRPVFDWPVKTKAEDGGGLAARAVDEKRPGTGRQICTSMPGKDLGDAEDLVAAEENSTASACRSRCASTQKCKGYAFDPSRSSTCWLKKGPCQGDYAESEETGDMVAGKCREGRPLLDWPLRATSREQGLLERFRVTQGARKDSVALLSHHGTYVTAQSDGSLTVDGDSVGDWESFEEVWLEDDLVALRTFHGGFLTAARDGTVSVGATSLRREPTRPSEAEEGGNIFGRLLVVIAEFAEDGTSDSFEVVVNSDDSVSLKTSWGNYLTAVREGTVDGVVLRGDRDTIGSWATFVLRAKTQEDKATGWLDMEVTLQSYLGTYIGVSTSGKVMVIAQEANLTACEGFWLVDGGDGTVALKTCMGTFLSAMEDGSVTADQQRANDWEHFRIETVHSRFFSALDLPVLKTGNLTGAGTTSSEVDPRVLPFGEPQSVVLKTFHGGYLFPVEEAARAPWDARPSEGWRVTQAMIFTRTCEEAGMVPITDRSTCEAAASRLGPARSSHRALMAANSSTNSSTDSGTGSSVDIPTVTWSGVPTVTAAGVPEGCYAENQTQFKLGTNSDNHGTGVKYRHDGTVLNPVCSGGCPTCTPSNPAPPAMVVLFYERDLCKMKLLAASITKHDPNLLIGTVHLVWLSTHPPSDFMGDIDFIRNAAAASHTVKFHDMSWMFSAGMSGWQTQQIVKLKASGLVEEDYYVVMDAKNALIRDVQPDTFLTSCYQAKVFADTDFDALNSDAKGWYYKSSGVLGVQIPPGRNWSASITPVVMHTQTVIDMLQDVHESPSPLSVCNGALCGHIRGGATEFTLYYLYAATKTDEKCIHRESPPNPALSMWRGFNDPNVVQRAMDDPNVLLFGGQSGSMPGGDDGQRLASQMQKLFEDAGIHDSSSSSADAFAACVVGG